MLYDTIPTVVKLTQAQYDALDPADQTNGTIYFITDGVIPPTGGLNATNMNITSAEYTSSELTTGT